MNPIYPPKDVTFDFPIHADKQGVVELWDNDILVKEYLDELALPLDDWGARLGPQIRQS